MRSAKIERWCQKNNWTEPRQLEIGIWVAFPPGGVMETPLPLKVQKAKGKLLESIVDTILLVFVTLSMLAIAVIMSPCFIEPLINRRRNSSNRSFR